MPSLFLSSGFLALSAGYPPLTFIQMMSTVKTYRRNVFVDYLPPMNTAHTRRHWSAAHKEKQKWIKLLLIAFPKAKMPDQPLQKSEITITRMSSREPDFDNMVMAAKPIFDALQKRGIIVDDAPRNVKRDYRWRKETERTGTLIEIVRL